MLGAKNKKIIAALGAFLAIVVIFGLFLRSESNSRNNVPKGTADTRTRNDAETREGLKRRVTSANADLAGGGSTSILKVFGKVTSEEEHTPIANATILFFGDDRSNYTVPVLTVTTSSNGAYEVIVPKDKVPAREGVLAAKADGYASQIAKVFSGRGNSMKPIEFDFTLAKGVSISGNVVNFSGKPVAGAQIGRYQEISRTRLRADNPNQVFPSAQSNGDGSFELAGLPKNVALSLITTKRGYIPSLTEDIQTGRTDVRIVIREGEGAIEGFVYDTDGDPVADAPVKAIFMRKGTRPDFGYPRNPPNTNELYTYTDKEGFYEFPALLSGWQGVIAGYGAPVSRSVGDAVMLEPGDLKKLNLKFKPPADINGVVVQKGTNAPIAGVRVANQPEKLEVAFFQTKGGGVGRQESVSDGSGHFTLRMDRTVESEMLRFPAEISYALPVTLTGVAEEKWEQYRLPWGRTFDDKAEIRIEVENLTTITGVVLLPDEKTPAGDAEVGVQQRGGFRGGPPGFPQMEDTVRVDAAGKFTLKVGAGANHRIVAQNKIGRGVMDLEVPNEGLKDPITITLEQYATIAGTVTDPDGKAMAAVTVRATQMSGEGERRNFSMATTITKPDGTYLLEQVMGGNVRVSIDEKKEFLRPDAQEVDLSSGENKTGIDFQYRTGVSFEGIVLDNANQPISGALVSQGRRFGPGGRRDNAVETDDSGKFKFDAIEPEGDTIRLEVTHPSYDSVTKGDLLPEDSPVTIIMNPRMHVEFTVAQGGSPVPDFQYAITPTRNRNAPQEGSSGGGEGNRGGRGNFGGGRGGPGGGMFGGGRLAAIQKTVIGQTDPVKETLTAGTYEINVYALGEDGQKNGSYGYQTFELSAQQDTATLTVELGSSLSVAGVVLTAEDKPVANASVEMSNRSAERAGRRGGIGFPSDNPKVMTDAQGNFKFDNVAVGRVRFTATAPNLVQDGEAAANITMEEAPPQVVIRMTNGSTIVGNVIDVDGRPMTQGSIRLSGESGGDAKLDSEGNFRFEKLAPGDYTVSLRGKTNATIHREQVKLASAEEKQVNIDFTGQIDVLGQVTRNGAPETDPGTRLTFEPAEKGKATNINLSRDGYYETRILPGEYKIYVHSNGGRAKSYTGISSSIQSTPTQQTIDIPLRLESIDVVIVDTNDKLGYAGKFNFRHKTRDGVQTNTNWQSSDKSFTITNQPPGECMGVLTTTDGRKYTSEWTKISESSEKILTLIPEDVAGGGGNRPQ
ncbi:carboxypeptidase regulatory-like domain-containing protein [Candidatus Sumerlaeota bacterium]|nr:carboxypeptidase regulatory-like domain-containing protein [Candidatus Sumerlaeota bacterium]